jgi:hypothetical protein
MKCVRIGIGNRLIVSSRDCRRAQNDSAPSRFSGLAPPGVDLPHHKRNFKELDLPAWPFKVSGGQGFCLFANEELEELGGFGAVS